MIVGICSAGAADATAAGPLPPRLVAAERNGQLLLLLPETHAGLRNQYDRYFQTVIAPRVCRVQPVAERALITAPGRGLRYQPCPDQQPDETQVDAALNAVLPELLPASYRAVQPPPAPVSGFSRFMRFDPVMEDAFFNPTGRYAPPWVAQAKPAVPADVTTNYASVTTNYAGRLMPYAPRPYAPVDTPVSSYQAYCSLAPAQRTALAQAALQKRLRQAGHAPPPDQLDRHEDDENVERRELEADVARLDRHYRDWLRRITQTVAGEQGTAATSGAASPDGEMIDQHQRDRDRYVLAARNQVWIARLPRMTAGERLPFMVLGAAHLPDSSAGPGLLRLLREGGYRLTLVRNHAQLAAPNTPAPPHEPIRETTLGGLCVDLPKRAMCTWVGGHTLVNLVDNGTPRSTLNLRATHETA